MEKADSSAEALGLEFAKAKEYVKYVAATMESEEFKVRIRLINWDLFGPIFSSHALSRFRHWTPNDSCD